MTQYNIVKQPNKFIYGEDFDIFMERQLIGNQLGSARLKEGMSTSYSENSVLIVVAYVSNRGVDWGVSSIRDNI